MPFLLVIWARIHRSLGVRLLESTYIGYIIVRAMLLDSCDPGFNGGSCYVEFLPRWELSPEVPETRLYRRESFGTFKQSGWTYCSCTALVTGSHVIQSITIRIEHSKFHSAVPPQTENT